VPIARLNRDTLRALADSRLEESRVLLENQFWTGAYYMTGLAVECALKSCLAREVKEYDFPDKEFVAKMYTHDLEKLFVLNGRSRRTCSPLYKTTISSEGIGVRSKTGRTANVTKLLRSLKHELCMKRLRRLTLALWNGFGEDGDGIR